MIIKISYPSRITPKLLKRKTREFQHQCCQSNFFATQKYSSNKAQILFNKRNLLLNFDSTDNHTVSILREYISFVFKDILIGVDQPNPLTANLDNANVYLFSEGRIC